MRGVVLRRRVSLSLGRGDGQVPGGDRGAGRLGDGQGPRLPCCPPRAPPCVSWEHARVGPTPSPFQCAHEARARLSRARVTRHTVRSLAPRRVLAAQSCLSPCSCMPTGYTDCQQTTPLPAGVKYTKDCQRAPLGNTTKNFCDCNSARDRVATLPRASPLPNQGRRVEISGGAQPRQRPRGSFSCGC